jgi:hypothetical protein
MLMKKITLIMFCLLVLLSGCNVSDSSPDSYSDGAYVGTIDLIIIGVNSQEILVKTNEIEKEDKEVEEDEEDEEDMGIWYTIVDSTELVNQRNRNISFYDLRVGSKVKVWGRSNFLLLSNPPRTSATKLKLISQ